MFHISMPSKKKSGTASPDTSSPRLSSAQLESSPGGTTSSNSQSQQTNSMPPPTSTNRLHSLGRAKSRGETSSASTSRTNSPSPADDPALVNNQPKRASSFRSLGLTSIGSGLSRAAGEVVHGIGKSNKEKEKEKIESGTFSVPSTPPVNGGYFNFRPGQNGTMASPDPSHLADFSLSLSELVNKAFAPCSAGSSSFTTTGILPNGVISAVGGNHPSSVKPKKKQAAPPLSSIQYEGGRLPEKSKVVEISELITKELIYASSVDSYLLRAVSRQALKALTLFSNRIDGLLIPISKDNGAMRIPNNLKEGVNLPTAMEFNLGLITLEWIVEDSLERCLDGRMESNLGLENGMPSFVYEILTPVRQKMERTILHVIQPLLVGIKSNLTTCINQSISEPFASNLSNDNSGSLKFNSPHKSPETMSPPIQPTTSNGQTSSLPTPSKEIGGTTSLLGRSDHSISHSSPNWLKELEARLEGARALLVPRIEERCGQDGEGWFISVVIHLIWKGLVILSSRSSEPFGNKAYDSSLLASSPSIIEKERNHHGRSFGLSKEYHHSSSSRTPSPAQLSNAIKAVSLSGGGHRKLGSNGNSISTSGRNTPSNSILEGNVGLNSNSINQNSSTLGPSRNTSSKTTNQQISELQTFEKLVYKFSKGFISNPSISDGSLRSKLSSSSSSNNNNNHNKINQKNSNSNSGLMVDGEESESDSDDDDEEEDELARAALSEAIQSIKSTIIVLQHIDIIPVFTLNALCRSKGCNSNLSTCDGIPNGVGSTSGSNSPPLNDTTNSTSTNNVNATVPVEVLKAFKAIPSLILLHLVYSRLPRSSNSNPNSEKEKEIQNQHNPSLEIPSPPNLFGYSWLEYEKAIVGFNGGEIWSGALVNGWKDSLTIEWNKLLEKEKSLKEKESIREKERKEAFNHHHHQSSSTLKSGLNELNKEIESSIKKNENGNGIESEGLAVPARSLSVTSSDSESSLPEAMIRSAPTLEKEKSNSINKTSSKINNISYSSNNSSEDKIPTSPTCQAGESLSTARDALLQRQGLNTKVGMKNSIGVPPEGHQIINRSNTSESERGLNGGNAGNGGNGNGSSSSSPLPSPGIGPSINNHSSNSNNVAPNNAGNAKPRFWRSSSSSQRTFHLPSLSRNASPRGRIGSSDLESSQVIEDHHHNLQSSIYSSSSSTMNQNHDPSSTYSESNQNVGTGTGLGNQASLILGSNGEWIQINDEDKELLKEREMLNLERFGLLLFRKCLAAVGQNSGIKIE